MNSSDSVGDIALGMYDFAYDVAPGGSIGDLVTGVLAIPANLLFFVAEVLYDFGS